MAETCSPSVVLAERPISRGLSLRANFSWTFLWENALGNTRVGGDQQSCGDSGVWDGAVEPWHGILRAGSFVT